MVGLTRLELATFWTPSKRATNCATAREDSSEIGELLVVRFASPSTYRLYVSVVACSTTLYLIQFQRNLDVRGVYSEP